MSASSPQDAAPLRAWQAIWFEPIPPHVYALLRIALGVIGFITVLGLSDRSAFWQLSGFVAEGDGGLGVKPWLLAHGWGDAAGTVVLVACACAYLTMAIGYASGISVTFALIASLFQLAWNYLPLSGAHQAFQAFLFCLIWADCGSVWSLDAWLARRRTGATTEPRMMVIAPLQLIRVQVALIYLNSGLWKLAYPAWRDGSAVHYVLNNNIFQRFPGGVPFGLEGLAIVATYLTLFWELTFPVLVLSKATRRATLLVGVLIHLGMLLFLEIGPFHVVMLASYLAFLDPHRVARWTRVFDIRRRGSSAVPA